MDHPGVYVGVCLITAKLYVGSSVRCRTRIREHVSALCRGNHPNLHLQSAWNKHGENNFLFEVIEQCEADRRFDREQWWINHLGASNSSFGFNQLNSVNSFPPAEIMSAVQKDYWASLSEEERVDRVKHLIDPGGNRKDNSERLLKMWLEDETFQAKVLDGLTRGREKTNSNPSEKQLAALALGRNKAIAASRSVETKERLRQYNRDQWTNPVTRVALLAALDIGRAKINAAKKAKVAARKLASESGNDIV